MDRNEWSFEAALAHGNTKAELPFESCEKPGKQKRGNMGGGGGRRMLKTGLREKDALPGSEKAVNTA